MEKTTTIFLEYGLLGAIVIVLAYSIFKLYSKVIDLQKDLVSAKDIELQRKDKDSEQYINILEKTLNALTAIEKSVFENNSTLSQKVIDSIEKANAPLIVEIKSAINSYKDGKANR